LLLNALCGRQGATYFDAYQFTFTLLKSAFRYSRSRHSTRQILGWHAPAGRFESQKNLTARNRQVLRNHRGKFYGKQATMRNHCATIGRDNRTASNQSVDAVMRQVWQVLASKKFQVAEKKSRSKILIFLAGGRPADRNNERTFTPATPSG
jgi:hypothetical protein